MRLNSNMSMTEGIIAMSDGNPGAVTTLLSLLQMEGKDDFDSIGAIMNLDYLGIYGPKIYMIGNDCCKRNQKKLIRTLKMIMTGVFTQEQIHTNLERCYALPFIDDSIKMDGVPPYDENFGPKHPMWEKWCKAQKESFEHRSK